MLMYHGYLVNDPRRVGYGDFWDDLLNVGKTVVGVVNKVVNPGTTPQPTPVTVPAAQVVPTQQGMVSVPFLGNMNATTLMLGIGAIGAAWIFLSKKGRR